MSEREAQVVGFFAGLHPCDGARTRLRDAYRAFRHGGMGAILRVVLVHNHYQQPGGEDQVVAAEALMLVDRGCEVTQYSVHNDAVAAMSRTALARAAIWSNDQYRALRTLFRRVQPDVVHVHNTLPLVSPAVYPAARAEGVAVVQTLHNYRMVCPSALLYRDGAPCQLCVSKMVPWPSIVHACYRNSRPATAVVAASLVFHRLRGTYQDQVDRYIALTEFAKARFIEGGLPASRIVVKPNFLPSDTGSGAGSGGYALFVGRLSPEKGLGVLMDAWGRVGSRLPLRIVGDGPMVEKVAAWAATSVGVTLLGRLSSADVMRQMRDAAVLILPSTCYEGFPMTVVEALAVGTPILASRIGGLEEIVDNERTGILFEAGNPVALALAVVRLADNPEALVAMRSSARGAFLERYTSDVNYEQLQRIYQEAVSQSSSTREQGSGAPARRRG